MATFKTYKAFREFRQSVAFRGRFVREPAAQDFLETVLEGAADRQVDLPQDYLLWRAQIGSAWDDDPEYPGPRPHPPERMKPRRTRALEGRVNPKGLPVLYMATTKETAMAEVRPAKAADISLAQFKVVRDLTIVDFSTDDERRKFHFSEPDEPERTEAVWVDIDHAFSAPTRRSDDGAEYVATQVIADIVRAAGYDGIAYQSGLATGHNIALFDLDAARLHGCAIWTVTAVTYEFSQVSNPYVMRESDDTGRSETEPADPQG